MNPHPSGLLAWTATSQTRAADAQLLLASQRVEEVGVTSVVSVVGSYGLGKTSLVERKVDQYYRQANRTVLRLQLQAAPKPREIATLLLRQLGVYDDVPVYLLRELLVDALRDTRNVIVIDEAHHMTIDPLRTVKVFIDATPTTDWILIGTPQLPTQLDKVPELRDRVSFPITIAPLTLDEVLRTIPAAHPLLADAPAELIAEVDQELAHGRWRPWRDFTAAAAQIALRSGDTTLTPKIATAAIASCGGPRPTPQAAPKPRRRRTRS